MERVIRTSWRPWIYVALMLGGTAAWFAQYGTHHTAWTAWLVRSGLGNPLAKNLVFALFVLGFGLVVEVATRLAWLGSGKLGGDPALKRWLVVLITIACGVIWMTLIPMLSRRLPDAAASVAFYLVVLYGGLVGIGWAAVRVGRYVGVFPRPRGKQHAA